MRLIDADAVKKTHYLFSVEDEIDADMVTFVKKIVADVLDHAPTVDAVPTVHSHWEYIGGYGYQYRCPECIMCAEYKTAYCPHCGAKMDHIGEKVTE